MGFHVSGREHLAQDNPRPHRIELQGALVEGPTRRAARFKQGSEACREFTTALSSGKKKDSVKGVACRSGEGEWVFKL